MENEEVNAVEEPEKSYTQKYQNMYYNTVTKEKRRKKSIVSKRKKTILKKKLLAEPKSVKHFCPECLKWWTELSSSVKYYEKKVCPKCKNAKMSEYQKEYEHRAKANERRRERYKSSPEYREKLKESLKKYKEKLKEIKKTTPITNITYKHTCPQCNNTWEEIIPSNKHSHPSKVCPECKENKRIKELKKVRKPRGRKPFKLEAEFTTKRVILKKKSNSNTEVQSK